MSVSKNLKYQMKTIIKLVLCPNIVTTNSSEFFLPEKSFFPETLSIFRRNPLNREISQL